MKLTKSFWTLAMNQQQGLHDEVHGEVDDEEDQEEVEDGNALESAPLVRQRERRRACTPEEKIHIDDSLRAGWTSVGAFAIAYSLYIVSVFVCDLAFRTWVPPLPFLVCSASRSLLHEESESSEGEKVYLIKLYPTF